MKKIIAFLAAMVAATPAYADTEFRWTEQYIFSTGEDLVMITDSDKVKVNYGPKTVWFVGNFFATNRDKTPAPIQVYPYFNEDKSVINFTTVEKDSPIFIYDCNKVKAPQSYLSSDLLVGGSMDGFKDKICSKFFGKDWKFGAERAEEREYETKDYSLKLRYAYLGYMKVEFDPRDFRYDEKNDVVKVYFKALEGDGIKWTVDRRIGMKPIYRPEPISSRYTDRATGTYRVPCKSGFLGNLSRTIGRFEVENPVTNRVELEGFGVSTQNKICKYKTEYKPI